MCLCFWPNAVVGFGVYVNSCRAQGLTIHSVQIFSYNSIDVCLQLSFWIKSTKWRYQSISKRIPKSQTSWKWMNKVLRTSFYRASQLYFTTIYGLSPINSQFAVTCTCAKIQNYHHKSCLHIATFTFGSNMTSLVVSLTWLSWNTIKLTDLK